MPDFKRLTLVFAGFTVSDGVFLPVFTFGFAISFLIFDRDTEAVAVIKTTFDIVRNEAVKWIESPSPGSRTTGADIMAIFS